MRAIKSTRFAREDWGDAALMAALATPVILSLEFLFTAVFVHHLSPAVFAIEGVAAAAAATAIAIVAVKATPDD